MYARALIPVLVLCSACQRDSVTSGWALEELMGRAPPPAEPALELRWYAGQDLGLTVQCTLVGASIADEAEVVSGTLGVALGEEPEPPLWLEGEGFSWALGLLVLVDAELYQPPDVEAAPLRSDRGAWGIADAHALLFVEGDLEAAADAVLVVPDEAPPLDGSPRWVELMLPRIAAEDGFEGGISLVDGPLGPEESQADLLPVTALDWLDGELSLRVFSGEALAGVVAGEGCP